MAVCLGDTYEALVLMPGSVEKNKNKNKKPKYIN